MRKAILISINEDLDEMRSLLQTLEVVVSREVVQRRDSPHRNTYLGPGKIEEVANDVKNEDIDSIVVNGILRPSQHHALEMLFKKECIDRVGVILRIFAEHAHTEEAKSQVALATLRYELPFLREWIHKAKSGERPGFLSGGAYATEVYYEHARSHIRRIEEGLNTHSRQREIRRTRRRDRGYYLVSLTGYTNAGKSAILNALCDAQVEVDGRLFSTLSTTTRRMMRSSGNVLLTDTVGFIKDLPPDLVNAFSSTLEEIFLSDLILIVVDVGEPLVTIQEKVATCDKILLPRIKSQKVVVVANKVDLLSMTNMAEAKDEIAALVRPYEIVFVSTITGEGLDTLTTIVEESEGKKCRMEARLPLTNDAFSLISTLHDFVDVEQTTSSDSTHLVLTFSDRLLDRIQVEIRAVGGRISSVRHVDQNDAEHE
ncbi:MAG: GTPase HflX [Thermoplasmata archaeon]|nr:GTPase HflX [Thermoplasmata archaeon]